MLVLPLLEEVLPVSGMPCNCVALDCGEALLMNRSTCARYLRQRRWQRCGRA